eukprot:Rhum_TRINITY_DN14509_c3_g1::Rhum_TRINITY_DN14509_c3_g1_i2::g.94195::m.94195
MAKLAQVLQLQNTAQARSWLRQQTTTERVIQIRDTRRKLALSTVDEMLRFHRLSHLAFVRSVVRAEMASRRQVERHRGAVGVRPRDVVDQLGAVEVLGHVELLLLDHGQDQVLHEVQVPVRLVRVDVVLHDHRVLRVVEHALRRVLDDQHAVHRAVQQTQVLRVRHPLEPQVVPVHVVVQPVPHRVQLVHDPRRALPRARRPQHHLAHVLDLVHELLEVRPPVHRALPEPHQRLVQVQHHAQPLLALLRLVRDQRLRLVRVRHGRVQRRLLLLPRPLRLLQRRPARVAHRSRLQRVLRLSRRRRRRVFVRHTLCVAGGVLQLRGHYFEWIKSMKYRYCSF